MVTLYGRKYTRPQLLKYVGDISQIARVRTFQLNDGIGKGVDVAEFRTGSGLGFNVLIGRGMDISYAEYKGIPLCWRSATGDVAAQFHLPEGLGWLQGFHGGLLNSCGLTYAGAPCIENGKDLGLHGRASYTPAGNICTDGVWEGNEYRLSLRGKFREATVFAENLCFSREIAAYLGESRFYVHDTVENLGYQTTPHMLIYHINIGFPIVDDGAELIGLFKETIPRDAEAEKGKEEFNRFHSPVIGYKEKAYYHRMNPDKNGIVTVALVNKKFNNNRGIGIYLKYNVKFLPWFIEWKMMDAGTYVVGMEPANCQAGGRVKEGKEGRLEYLKPGGRKEYRLELGVLKNNTEINELRKRLKSLSI